MPKQQPPDLPDRLSDFTDSVLDHRDFQYSDVRSAAEELEIEAYTDLILQLHTTLTEVPVSPAFRERLRAEIIYGERQTVLSQVRHMPLHVQLMAGLMTLLGAIFLFRRRSNNTAPALPKEAKEAETISLP